MGRRTFWKELRKVLFTIKKQDVSPITQASQRMDIKQLTQTVLKQFKLDLKGTHGIPHWARVLENGRKLCELNGANRKVVDLFALFHDSKRELEGKDRMHGQRGAEFAYEMRSELDLTDHELELLMIACADHTKGLTEGDLTVQTCWDADRLDLGRILVTPDPTRLCTDAAKSPEILEWSNQKAIAHTLPKSILKEWGCEHMKLNSYKSHFWRTLGRIKQAFPRRAS